MKTFLRFFVLFAVIIISISVLVAQNTTKDVVYLKNGGVIKGNIIEMIPEKSVKIQTGDGSVFVYTMAEIEKIGKETVQSSEQSNMFGNTSQSMPSVFSIFGGVSLPVGDFGSDDLEKEGAGFAKTGYAAGLQFVTGGQVGFVINATFAQNSFAVNEDMFYFNTSDMEGGSWTSAMLLAGPKIGTVNPVGANFFFAPLVGMDMIWTPKITGKISDDYYVSYYSYPYYYYGYVPITGDAKINSKSSTSFAYGAMAEVVIGNITLGARFIASSKVKYEMKEEGTFSGSNSSIRITSGSYTRTAEVEIGRTVVCIYLGIGF
jgi:hypothetical protein